jgi:hypothetical protein
MWHYQKHSDSTWPATLSVADTYSYLAHSLLFL